MGKPSRPAAQPKCRVSDSNGLRREADQFCGGASRRGAVTAAKADRAHAVGSAGRTNDCLNSLGSLRAGGASETVIELAKSESGVERSGPQSWRVGSESDFPIVRGPNSAETWREENRRVNGECASTGGERSASFSSVRRGGVWHA